MLAIFREIHQVQGFIDFDRGKFGLGLALVQAQAWSQKRVEDLPKADRDFINLSQQAENDRREASRQLEIERIKAQQDVARLNAEKEAQERARRTRERGEDSVMDLTVVLLIFFIILMAILVHVPVLGLLKF